MRIDWLRLYAGGAQLVQVLCVVKPLGYDMDAGERRLRI